MSKQPEPGVIGSLPRTRPHRRSDKRAAPAGADAPPASAKPASAKPKPRTARPKPKPTVAAAVATPPPPREPAPGALETAVQAAAELAEIGLHAGARALRRAVSRLPRP